MNQLIRITTAVGKVNAGNPKDCAEELCSLLDSFPAEESGIILLPRLALCSPSCGSLFSGRLLPEQCEAALEELKAHTAPLPGYVIVGLATNDWGGPVSAMAVLYRGELLGLIPTLDNPPPLLNSGYSANLLPPETLFACGELRFSVLGCGLSTLPMRAAQAASSGCDLLLVPAYSPVYAGLEERVRDSLHTVTQAAGCAVALVNGGVGETSSPYVYRGFAGIYEAGECVGWQTGGSESFSLSGDVDVDVLRATKKFAGGAQPIHAIPVPPRPAGLLRPLPVCPWLPQEGEDRYLEELFRLQVRSLAARMENIGVSRLVVGVSGGLDSTAALLAGAAAMDMLGLPRENLLGITMPGFGTSDRTYYNALSLLDNLGASRRDISIRQAVQLHLEDIGHSGKKDTTYENAQARERTQILLDVANAVSGLVVGTGDLSEEALGFCTFAGDHMANYNVNVCIPKTVLRRLVRHVAENGPVTGCAEVLLDILDTPVSPELLPPAETGEIKQKTEEILGPYELHDFFLYHFIKYHLRPAKLYHYACTAFAGELEPTFIKEKLAVFLGRFCAAQFKRSCAPDAASITEVNLLGINYTIPSDLDPSLLLLELETL